MMFCFPGGKGIILPSLHSLLAGYSGTSQKQILISIFCLTGSCSLIFLEKIPDHPQLLDCGFHVRFQT